MIDVEPQIYTTVALALKNVYKDISVVGRTIYEPSNYPCVCIEQTDAMSVSDTRDTGSTQNHIEVTYTVNVFSKKPNTAKSEAKEIMSQVDNTLCQLGFTLLGCVPVAMADATKYRLTARYRAIIGNDEKIYRA